MMISKSRAQKQTLGLRMDKLSRLRDTIDGNLIGREPAPVQNDVQAGRMNSMIRLRIASIRNIFNQRTQKDSDKGCK